MNPEAGKIGVRFLLTMGKILCLRETQSLSVKWQKTKTKTHKVLIGKESGYSLCLLQRQSPESLAQGSTLKPSAPVVTHRLTCACTSQAEPSRTSTLGLTVSGRALGS